MLRVNEFITTEEASVSISAEEFDRVLEDVENPPQPTEALTDLMHSKAPWD